MSLYAVSDKTLASIAEAIRNKSGNSKKLTFPKEFISEINGISSSELNYNIYFNTTENWNTDLSYVPNSNDIIIYTDKSILNGKNVPGIKIGDGNAYLVDLPFITDDLAYTLMNHINDSVAHITAEERTFWNNKINLEVKGEELLFNRN